MRKKTLFRPNLTADEMKDFEKNVKDNMKRAYFTALGLVGSHDYALELSQEAFIRAYRNYKKFDRSKKFFTWYYRILKNLCLNFIRDSKKNQSSSFIDISESLKSGNDPVKSLETMELQKKVQDALLNLTEDDREIITLKEFQDLSYKEISEMLEIPIGTVMSKLFYARKRLARNLKGVL